MKLSNGFKKLSDLALKVEEKIDRAKAQHDENVRNKEIDKCTKVAEKLGLKVVK